jgi:hypothetical protein
MAKAKPTIWVNPKDVDIDRLRALFMLYKHRFTREERALYIQAHCFDGVSLKAIAKIEGKTRQQVYWIVGRGLGQLCAQAGYNWSVRAEDVKRWLCGEVDYIDMESKRLTPHVEKKSKGG